MEQQTEQTRGEGREMRRGVMRKWGGDWPRIGADDADWCALVTMRDAHLKLNDGCWFLTVVRSWFLTEWHSLRCDDQYCAEKKLKWHCYSCLNNPSVITQLLLLPIWIIVLYTRSSKSQISDFYIKEFCMYVECFVWVKSLRAGTPTSFTADVVWLCVVFQFHVKPVQLSTQLCPTLADIISIKCDIWDPGMSLILSLMCGFVVTGHGCLFIARLQGQYTKRKQRGHSCVLR